MAEQTREPIIEVSDLFVVYNEGQPNEARVLENIDLKIYPREYVIIFGPSGCGKSTLLNVISGLLRPTKGKVEIGKEDINTFSKKQKVNFRRKKIGMVFQSFFLVPTLKIVDNVGLPKTFLGEEEAEREKISRQLLERFGIGAQADKFPAELSGGQRQRVAIVRSLVNNPEIIFADEPVGNLDSKSSYTVMSILTELNEIDKKTIILVTHDPNHLTYGDKVVYMSDGKIVKVEETVKKDVPRIETGEELREKEKVAREWESFSKGKLGKIWELYQKGELEKDWDLVRKEELGKAWNAFKGKEGDKWKLGDDWKIVRKDELEKRETISPELLMLSKSFKNFSPTQVGTLFIPFKAEQIFSHIFFHMPTDQIENAKKIFQDTLSGRITIEDFVKKLDAPRGKGGAGFHKKSAEKLAAEVKRILDQAAKIDLSDTYKSATDLAEYMKENLKLDLAETKYRLVELIKDRLDNKISIDEFREAADRPIRKKGMGLVKGTADRLARELEILLLARYGG
jgi:putative ABC transport system ATP-binding protein